MLKMTSKIHQQPLYPQIALIFQRPFLSLTYSCFFSLICRSIFHSLFQFPPFHLPIPVSALSSSFYSLYISSFLLLSILSSPYSSPRSLIFLLQSPFFHLHIPISNLAPFHYSFSSSIFLSASIFSSSNSNLQFSIPHATLPSSIPVLSTYLPPIQWGNFLQQNCPWVLARNNLCHINRGELIVWGRLYPYRPSNLRRIITGY